LLVISGGVVTFVIQRQKQTVPQEQRIIERESVEREESNAQPANNYHEARKKAGQFLVPDTKSRMRFGEEASSTPTPAEPRE
jgi:hypothetical protein